MSETKTYAVVLHTQWADELGPILEPYLYPMRAGFEDFRVLYANKIETQAPFVEASVSTKEGVEVVLRLPHGVVRLMVEAGGRSPAGFIGGA